MGIFQPNMVLYYIISICALLCIYGVGRLFLYLFGEWKGTDESSSLFTGYMIGSLILISLISIIWTRGNTIYLLSLIAFFLYLWWRKADKPMSSTHNWAKELRLIGFSVVLFTIIFSLFYYLIFVRSNGAIYQDLIYYSNASHEIFSYHHESVLRIDASIAQPYHWHEHWLNAIVTNVFGLNYLYTLCLFTYPFFLMLSICGFAAIAKSFKSIPIPLCICLGILGVFFWIPSSYISPWHDTAFINLPKLYIINMGLIWGVILMVQQRISQSIVAFLMVCAEYSTLIPGILTFVVLFSFVYYYQKQVSWRQILFNKYAIGAVLVAVFILLFYGLQPKGMETTVLFKQGDDYIADALSFIVKRIARPIAMITPIVLLSYFVYFRKNKNRWYTYLSMVCALLLSCIAAIMMGGVVRQVQLDGGQIATNYYENICRLFVYVSTIALLSYAYKEYKKIVALVVPILMMLYISYSVYHTNSNMNLVTAPASIEEQCLYSVIKEHIASAPIQSIGYVRNYNTEENKNTHKTRCNVVFPMSKLVHVIPGGYYRPYCLSIFDLPDDIEPLWNDMQESELYQYSLTYNKEVEKDEIIKDFVHNKGINYIVIEKDADVPVSLQNMTNLIAEINGDRLLKIKL